MGLAASIRRLTQRSILGDRRSTCGVVDERPACAFGAVVQRHVHDLDAVISRVETKVNALLGGLALAIALEILRSVLP